MSFDYESRFAKLRSCISLGDDDGGDAWLVIDKPGMLALIAEFAECDWDAGADSVRDGLGSNPHRVG